VLVSTDLAARGIDFRNVTRVVQFDFATNVVDFIHRVGRTARSGMRLLSHVSISWAILLMLH
jgi:superfamily II DNA/RNA helicase